MQTKHIDKLEDLNGFEWEYQGKEFFFRIYTLADEYTLALAIKKFKDYKTGEEEEKNLIHFSLRNLTELEFYGLKVVLNEKPKLTRKEQERISRESYFARDENDNLYEYLDKPRQSKEFGRWQTNYAFIQINPDLFNFITWESGKAWSKSELMKLKSALLGVMEKVDL